MKVPCPRQISERVSWEAGAVKGLVTIAGVAIAGLLVGTAFGFVGASLTGNAGLRVFGPIAGLVSAILAWRAAGRSEK